MRSFLLIIILVFWAGSMTSCQGYKPMPEPEYEEAQPPIQKELPTKVRLRNNNRGLA